MFLGEWCKLYERRHVWTQRNHETVQFHWDDRDKLKRDYDYLESLYRSLLKCLAASLNKLHHVNYSVRYWQIQLGFWLMAYVSAVYDRWESLRIAFEQNAVLETILPDDPVAVVPPFSSPEAITEMALSDEWNFSVCRRIIESEYSCSCVIRREKVLIGGLAGNRQGPASGRRLGFLRRFASRVDRFLGNCFFKYDTVFLTSYFNYPALIRLNLAIGQIPRLFPCDFELYPSSDDSSLSGIDYPDRSGMRLNFQPESAFEEFVNQSIIRAIPYCSVEGYAALRDRVSNVTIKTKAIVTADNNHWSNVCAKAWMAEQVENGAKLVMLEHGGSLPAYKELFNFEEDISDIRATWFLPYHPKHVRLPPSRLVCVFKKTLPRLTTSSSRKYCSVIGNECARYVYRAHYYPMAAQCLVSFDLVVRFYERLNDEVKQVFKIKPYPNQGWNTWQRYSDVFGPERILSEKTLDRVFCLSKLVVCTYPETTFSEAMGSGLPTVLIYPEYLYERHPVAIPLLEILRSANIVFHDPIVASEHVNAIWTNPNQWWNSPDVVHARAEFRRQALDLDSDWLKEWKSFLRSVIREYKGCGSPAHTPTMPSSRDRC